MVTMRLSPEQTRALVASVQRHLGSGARIWLFGSRLDGRARGGDVDLYVEADPHPLRSELRCKIELEEILDLPVDLVVRPHDDSAPIARLAKQHGARL